MVNDEVSVYKIIDFILKLYYDRICNIISNYVVIIHRLVKSPHLFILYINVTLIGITMYTTFFLNYIYVYTVHIKYNFI